MSQLLVLSEPVMPTSAEERRMSGARTDTLAHLRGHIERMESHGDARAKDRLPRVALGHAEADAALQGGLALGALHEVFAEGRQGAAATGFIAGLARRVSMLRPLLWVRQDFAQMETGALCMSGWRELGLDPRLVVTVRAPDGDTALRIAADALACDALGSARLGCHRAAATHGGGAVAVDGGDAVDRALRAFAACVALAGVGRARARCPAGSQSSWPQRPLDHGMEV
jgi:hypothetical protein